MIQQSSPSLERRVLVLAPTGGDAAVLCHVLNEAGVETAICETAVQLCHSISKGAAAAIVTDEALTEHAVQYLIPIADGQPEWSDFPLIILTARRSDDRHVWHLLEQLNGSASPLLLERPVSTATLTRAVRTVLQSRARQYQIRDQIAERERLKSELLQKVEELAESDRRKDEFLAVLGHELRNPLAAIVNGIQVLPMLGTLEEEADTICTLLGRQARQMTHLIDDLLDVSRISRGRIRLRLERIDLVDLIQEIAEEHSATADESGCTLHVQLPENLPVDGDPTRLRQIFGNLVHNACKFTDPGGRITITAHCEPERRTAEIAVRDTGIGMDEDSLEALFQPFHQAETSLDRSRSGLGLGLALVDGLVRLHGGAVTAHSEGLGSGSEFTVSLPLATGDAAAVTRLATAGQPSCPCVFRILLVEDSPPVAEIFSVFLRHMGHQVEVVQNAAVALERIPEYRPQIMISDISMPGMSGYELAQQVRQRSEWSDMILVAVTGYGQAEDCERARDAGFDYHLVKPVEPKEMVALFEAVANQDVP